MNRQQQQQSDSALLSEALAAALAAAALAGARIRAGLGTAHAAVVATKSGPSDVVTAVDQAVEADVVRLLQQRLPGIAVLGEEGGWRERSGGQTQQSDRADRYLWVVDPLDGTNNFANGLPLNCFCLALLDSGRPVVAVIADPHRQETFSAVAGQGAWLNGNERLHVQARSDSNRLAGGSTLLEVGGGWDLGRLRRVWERLFQAGSAIRVLGSAGLALAQLAAGRATGLVFGQMQPWDIAAGVLLVTEAGGAVSGWHGPTQVLQGSPLTAAANPAVLRELQAIVRDE